MKETVIGIIKDLNEVFPSHKFYVRIQNRPNLGDSTYINWNNGVSENSVDRLVKKYQKAIICQRRITKEFYQKILDDKKNSSDNLDGKNLDDLIEISEGVEVSVYNYLFNNFIKASDLNCKCNDCDKIFNEVAYIEENDEVKGCCPHCDSLNWIVNLK